MTEPLHFGPIEPTPVELERIAQQEAFYRELLTAFALTADEIGSLNVNLAHAQRQEEMYRKMVGR